MIYSARRPAPIAPAPIALVAFALLAGCSGSVSQQQAQAIYTVPTPQAAPYQPPVSQDYAARAPAPQQEQFAPLVPVERSSAYRSADLFEVDAAAGNDAPATRGVGTNRRIGGSPARYQSGFAPIEARETADTRSDGPAESLAADDPGMTARERAAETAAERQTRREASRVARANPQFERNPFFGRFVTRADTATQPEAASRTIPEQEAPATVPAPRNSTVPRPAPARPVAARPAQPSVAQAPIPGLKPYILARSPSPTSKPRRAAPQPPAREFEVAAASVLPTPTRATVSPSSAVIPTEPGADLSANFFPTPGKPSILGTDKDKPLDVASIDATRYGIGKGVGDVVDSDGATAEWEDAVRLIEAGEVEALAILEDADLVLTLCSGRDILTTPPDLAAAATLTAPQIICGLNKPLALR